MSEPLNLRPAEEVIDAMFAPYRKRIAELKRENAELRKDAERLNEIAAEYYTLEPFAMPTPGGDDADVGWRLTQQHQGKPKPVVIAEVYYDNPREAIDAAIASEKENERG